MRCILTHWVLLTYICRNELGWSLVYTSPARCQSLPVFRGSNEKKWMHISCFRKTGKTYSIQNCAFIWYVPLVGSFHIVTENMWKCSFCEQISQTLLLWYELRAQQQLFFKTTSQYITMTSPTMMTSSNETFSALLGPLCGESTGHRRIPLTKASDAELRCSLWSAPEQTVEQTIETRVIWEAIATIITSLLWQIVLFIYRSIQGNNTEIKKFPITDFCDGNLSVNGFPLQKASNAESGPK